MVLMSCGGDSTDTQPSNASNNTVVGSDPASSGGDAFPATTASAHNVSQVPQRVSPPANLIDNGGFESNNGTWDLCGTGQIINAPADAGMGDRYLQLDATALCDRFGQSILQESHGWAFHPINLSSVPEVLHVSLLARSSAPIELFEDPFAVRLMASNDRTDFFLRREAKFLNSVNTAVDDTWTRVKLSITREDIQTKLGDLVPQWLIIEAVGPGNDTVIGIDDIRLTTQPDLMQPDPLPASLTQKAAANRLIAYDLDRSRLVTMLGDGSSLHRYNVPTQNVVSYPTFAGNSSILFADRRFDPLGSSDPSVIPGAGSDIIWSNLPDTRTVISTQPGTAGVFAFAGSPGNRDAIDITVRSIAWDRANDRGINAVCAQNRSAAFVSDSVCLLQLMDRNGNTTLTDIEASSIAFSPDGSQIAFVATNAKQIFTGSLNGQTINARVTYESRSRLNSHVSFSPDGRSLLFSSASAASIYITEDNTLYPSVLKSLNLSNGKTTPLLLTDHGELSPNYTYSSDGSFIYYTIELANGSVQIWWLEVATG